MTVVLDCNILVMSLTSASPYHVIFESLVNGKFVLAVSTDIVLEYEEIIQQKYNTATAKSFINLLNELINVSYVHPYYHWQLITADLDDNKYCDCAIAGQAEYIVTEDKHFSVLKTVSFPSLTVIGINRFWESSNLQRQHKLAQVIKLTVIKRGQPKFVFIPSLFFNRRVN